MTGTADVLGNIYAGAKVSDSIKGSTGEEIPAYIQSAKITISGGKVSGDVFGGGSYQDKGNMQLQSTVKDDLLIHIHIHILHLLDAKGKLKVYTRICDIGDSSKGCHNTLLLVVHREETGEAADQKQNNDDARNNQARNLSAIYRFWRRWRRTVFGGRPAIAAVIVIEFHLIATFLSCDYI